MNTKFSMSGRKKSFSYALHGLLIFFKTQHNAWIHLTASAMAVTAGFYFELGSSEWCWIALAIGLVFIAEIFNTALEFLCDVVSPQIHPQIKIVKDVAAAAVLMAAIAAAVIGSIIFIPKLF